MISVITGQQLKDMVLKAAKILDNNKKQVDALNVFPVPDGDTGINMSLTMLSSVKEVEETSSDAAGDIAAALSKGALRGARGNSGVILSQIFRGFAKVIGKAEIIDADMLCRAIVNGSAVAYKAVMKPREGTILTVSRVMGETIMHRRTWDSIDSVLNAAIAGGIEALKKTPDLLPVLKEAGVVDAGGVGLLLIYKGFLASITGQDADSYVFDIPISDKADEKPVAAVREAAPAAYGYGTELTIKNLLNGPKQADIDWLREKLSEIGGNIDVTGDEKSIHVYVDSDTPDAVLQFALSLGEISGISINNLREATAGETDGNESAAVPEAPKEEEPILPPDKDYGLVAIAAGTGIADVFKDLTVDVVVEGGQTMNPSTDDILCAVRRSRGRTVFVFPNNPNIILAAQQAAELAEDQNVIVIPTRTIPEGISAVLAFNPVFDPNDNEERIKNSFGNTVTGQVTYAVRDSKYNGYNIKENDIIGLVNGEITEVGKDVNEVAMKLLDSMLDSREDSIVTIFYGHTTNEETAALLTQDAEEKFADCSVEAHFGGQPLYNYIISVE